MRFQSAVLAFAASLACAGAQDLSGIPSCALPCFVAALPASGCSVTDTTCQCTTGRDSITNSLSSCAPQKCSASDVAALAPAVIKICAAKGVTISNVPTAASSAASAAATSGASAASSGASAKTSALSGSRTASASGSSAPTSSGAAAQSTAAAPTNIAGLGAVAMGLAAAFL